MKKIIVFHHSHGDETYDASTPELLRIALYLQMERIFKERNEYSFPQIDIDKRFPFAGMTEQFLDAAGFSFLAKKRMLEIIRLDSLHYAKGLEDNIYNTEQLEHIQRLVQMPLNLAVHETINGYNAIESVMEDRKSRGFIDWDITELQNSLI